MISPCIPTVRFYHNHLWARYKGLIFSEIYSRSQATGLEVAFAHIAETSAARLPFGAPDRSYHRYPFKVFFSECYDRIPSYRLILELVRDLLRHRSDLVVIPGYHRVEYWAMLGACMLLRRKRAVFVDSTAYDREKNAWKERAKAAFFRRCDGFFCYGKRSRDYVESYGVDAKKIFDRCQAAALPRDYDPAAIASYHASKVSHADDAPRFIYIGRLSPEKGLYDLFEAFRLVLPALPLGKLLIVGSGPLDAELRERCKRLELESAVEFLGTKNAAQIGQLLTTSTAMVLPSHREPWGLVVNESLSYGCPVVVSSSCGCVPELVQEDLTGYSFPAGDVLALRTAMLAAAQLSKDRPSVSARCMDLAGRYTPGRAAEEILRGCVYILKTPQ